jgi:hypothetical protein
MSNRKYIQTENTIFEKITQMLEKLERYIHIYGIKYYIGRF